MGSPVFRRLGAERNEVGEVVDSFAKVLESQVFLEKNQKNWLSDLTSTGSKVENGHLITKG